jgi:hypothetical protein
MKVAVVGSREWPDEARVREYVRSLPEGTTLVSGGARGVDSWAADEARRRGFDVMVHWPDWTTHGRSAGFLRNHAIVRDAEKVVAFTAGSNGTQHTIDLARKAGKPVEVHRP